MKRHLPNVYYRIVILAVLLIVLFYATSFSSSEVCSCSSIASTDRENQKFGLLQQIEPPLADTSDPAVKWADTPTELAVDYTDPLDISRNVFYGNYLYHDNSQ